MEKLLIKLGSIQQALGTLDESITHVKEEKLSITNKPKMYRFMRDSITQRFEYCVDLFWKVLKAYLEDYEKITLQSVSPRNIIRDAVNARMLSEAEGSVCMEMITDRNKTSHMYHEEVAQDIVKDIPKFYELMCKVTDSITQQVKK